MQVQSPMAEFVMKDLVRKANLESAYFIDSAAVRREEIGNGIHIGTRKILEKHNIPYTHHRARQITNKDAEESDWIICMDQANIRYAKRLVSDIHHHKIRTLLNRDIADPWYTGNFETTFQDVLEGCMKLISKWEG